MPKEYRIIESNKDEVLDLSRALGISPILAKLLINRGVVGVKEAKAFLSPSLNDLRNPFLFDKMHRACLRIRQALESKERILIFGDWDVDGLTATSLLVRLLYQLKGEVSYYIPKDFGYGLDREGLNYAYRHGVKLIISVDCGIADRDEVEYASSLGIDCIITDHHPLPQDRPPPPALAIINPRMEDSIYPDPELSGVGVVFKLGQALLASYDGPEIIEDLSHPKMDYYFRTYLDLVALGTIADMAKLVGENRVFTKFGLAALNQTKKVGLRVLLSSLGLLEKDVGEWEVGFKVAPLLNAAGRMNRGHLGVELLTVKEKERAVCLTQKILSLNEKRRIKADKDTMLAIEYIEREVDLDQEKIIIVPLEECEGGVTGIVANRLLERYLRPVVVFACMGDEAIGSARSLHDLDLNTLLFPCRDLLIKFGGHKRAAGITIKRENIPLFRERINQGIDLDSQGSVSLLEVDQEILLSEITPALLEEIDRLRPFGEGNPEPLFLIRNIRPISIQRVGENKEHLKMILGIPDKGGYLEAIGWRMDIRDKDLMGADLVVKLKKRYWNGREQVQLVIERIFTKE